VLSRSTHQARKGWWGSSGANPEWPWAIRPRLFDLGRWVQGDWVSIVTLFFEFGCRGRAYGGGGWRASC
ncbi:MAG: hypothetical protein VYE81_03140, partial [Planctomycetota bacterium]|nr:hypothetical protein [Planctomycetota bacterium]